MIALGSKHRLASACAAMALAGVCALTAGLAGCSSGSDGSGAAGGGDAATSTVEASTAAEQAAAVSEPPQIEDLTYESTMDLQYATQFAVYYYEGGYKVLDVIGDAQYLVVPEGADVPANLPEGMAVLQQPVDHIYLAATATASLFDAVGGLGSVTMTGTDLDGWTVDSMIEAMQAGDITYVGKYSAPDYETLVDKGCDLALESTMILHSPDVKEALEQLGIPVMIEHSSYEGEPMGRVEWARFFGALLNREDEADAFFNEQLDLIADAASEQSTGKTVAFFSVNSNGQVIIRRPGDFITKSIDMAGGVYPFTEYTDDGKLSTMKISLEEFYAQAHDADYLVYNGTIESPLSSVDDLLDKNQTFAEYKAVKEGRLYTTDKDMYQATDKLAQLITDFHTLVTDGDEGSMMFLAKVD